VDLSKLTRGEKIVLGTGILLILDLLILPWHHISIGGLSAIAGISVNRTAVQSPNGFYGWLALLLALVMVAQIVVARFTTAKLPDIPVPWAQVHLIAGAAALALLVIKLVVQTNYLGFGCFLGIALAAGLAFGGFTVSQEARRPAGGTI
jgi:hypothetical protein